MSIDSGTEPFESERGDFRKFIAQTRCDTAEVIDAYMTLYDLPEDALWVFIGQESIIGMRARVLRNWRRGRRQGQ